MSGSLDLGFIMRMAHSPLHNYAGVPGLTSYLLGAPSDMGCVRIFHSEREHEEAITPHSHRFDFECQVLRGSVRNHIWTSGAGDHFSATKMKYLGKPGEFEREHVGVCGYRKSSHMFSEGEAYRMTHDQIHSINFSRGAVVLFFEGYQRTDTSVILEPWSNGERVPTFEVREWMYKPGSKKKGTPS